MNTFYRFLEAISESSGTNNVVKTFESFSSNSTRLYLSYELVSINLNTQRSGEERMWYACLVALVFRSVSMENWQLVRIIPTCNSTHKVVFCTEAS
ncbi:uncharacterized protein [Physcomitrium patens]|uniref:uncharacterized protein n=1 Tax=Physcomitrium patens TaxID=3218 RepID=UPI003CCCFABD